MATLFRDKAGRFTPATARGARLFVDRQRVTGKQRAKVKRRVISAKRKKVVAKRVARDIPSHAVPRGLTRDFAFFTENLDNIPDGAKRDYYAIVELGMGATSQGRKFDVSSTDGMLIPIRLPVTTTAKARRFTNADILDLAAARGITGVIRPVAVIAKRTNKDIRAAVENNPLVKRRKVAARASADKRRKAEIARRKRKRKKVRG